MFDPSRAPDGRHTAWGYCHVPNGSTVDMTDAIERQIERFAPGFGERVLARSAMGPADLERRNANLVGSDIAGGSNALRQLIARARPCGRSRIRRRSRVSTSAPHPRLRAEASTACAGTWRRARRYERAVSLSRSATQTLATSATLERENRRRTGEQNRIHPLGEPMTRYIDVIARP